MRSGPKTIDYFKNLKLCVAKIYLLKIYIINFPYNNMKYKTHKLDIKLAREPDRLEQFLNNLKGEVISIIPDVSTLFLCYGAKVKSIIIVEKITNEK